MIVRVPGSSANLGPGFDTLGIAVALYADAGVLDQPDDEPPAGAQLADEHHPVSIAFRRAGGVGNLWVRTSLPAGRGLGFSGAVRVGRDRRRPRSSPRRGMQPCSPPASARCWRSPPSWKATPTTPPPACSAG